MKELKMKQEEKGNASVAGGSSHGLAIYLHTSWDDMLYTKNAEKVKNADQYTLCPVYP